MCILKPNLDEKIEVLTKARGYISRGFTQGRMWNNKYASAWCARGAVFQGMSLVSERMAFSNMADAPYVVELFSDLPGPVPTVTDSCYPELQSVVDYNNSHEQAEVVALFDKTLARLRADRGLTSLRGYAAVAAAMPDPRVEMEDADMAATPS